MISMMMNSNFILHDKPYLPRHLPTLLITVKYFSCFPQFFNKSACTGYAYINLGIINSNAVVASISPAAYPPHPELSFSWNQLPVWL
jgi:hypothetical protein